MARLRFRRAVRKASFDLQGELRKALDFLLDCLAGKYKKSIFWQPGDYFTASDLESRVRMAALELVDGKEYGYYGVNRGYGSGMRVQGLRGESLLSHCRGFLFDRERAGELRADHPSGNTRCSSRMRFRPAGAPLTKAEQAAQDLPQEEKRRRESIVHYAPEVEVDRPWALFNRKPSNPLPYCQRSRPKKPVSYRAYTHRNPLRIASNPDKVTCKTCRKAMAKLPHPKAPALAVATPNGIVADWLDEHGQPELTHALRHPSDCKCEGCLQRKREKELELQSRTDELLASGKLPVFNLRDLPRELDKRS